MLHYGVLRSGRPSMEEKINFFFIINMINSQILVMGWERLWGMFCLNPASVACLHGHSSPVSYPSPRFHQYLFLLAPLTIHSLFGAPVISCFCSFSKLQGASRKKHRTGQDRTGRQMGGRKTRPNYRCMGNKNALDSSILKFSLPSSGDVQ